MRMACWIRTYTTPSCANEHLPHLQASRKGKIRLKPPTEARVKGGIGFVEIEAIK